jgi:preprotein translocase subunit YajC
MFITAAYAQAAGGDATSQAQNMLYQFGPIALIFGVFYFMLIRPQQQKAKDLKALQAGLRRGDRVITAGGIVGTINRVVSDEEVEVTIAENVRVRVIRSTITTLTAKTEPASAKDKLASPDKPGPDKPGPDKPGKDEPAGDADETETVAAPVARTPLTRRTRGRPSNSN